MCGGGIRGNLSGLEIDGGVRNSETEEGKDRETGESFHCLGHARFAVGPSHQFLLDQTSGSQLVRNGLDPVHRLTAWPTETPRRTRTTETDSNFSLFFIPGKD